MEDKKAKAKTKFGGENTAEPDSFKGAGACSELKDPTGLCSTQSMMHCPGGLGLTLITHAPPHLCIPYFYL